MREGARLRSLIILTVVALSVVVAGGSVAGSAPHPVLPVEGPPSGPAEPPPEEPADSEPEYECADGSTAVLAQGRVPSPIRVASTAALVVAPQPVLPVEGPPAPVVVEEPGPAVVDCGTELVLRLTIISPNDEKPTGTDATLDAGLVAQPTLESGYQATLPSQSRDIFLADPGEDWELTETSCICTGSTARGGRLLTSPAPSSTGSLRFASAPAPVIPVDGDDGSADAAVECGSAGAAAPSGLAMAPVAELTTFPGPVIPVEGDGSIDLFDEPSVPAATIDWDAAGTISIRDPFGAGGVFLCSWTVEPAKGRLTIKTTTKPSGEEDRFRYRVMPQFVHEDAAPFTQPGTSAPTPRDLRRGTWAIEASDLPDAWNLKTSTCEETQTETPSAAQGTSATAGIDGRDDVRCTFEMRLLTPEAGSWSARERPGRLSCPGGSFRLAGGTSAGRITVRDEGDRLIGRSVAAGGSSVTLRRDRDAPRVYTGRIRISLRGASGRLDYRLEFSSERKASGLMRGSVKVRGQTCTLRRQFTLSR